MMKLELSSLFSDICMHGQRRVFGITDLRSEGICGFMGFGDI